MRKRLGTVRMMVLLAGALALAAFTVPVQAASGDDPLAPSWFAAYRSSARVVETPSRDGPDGGEVLLQIEDAGRRVSLGDDQVLVVSLPVNPSTGYHWQTEDIQGAALRQVGETQFLSPSGLLGAPGRQIMRFVGTGKGDARLPLTYPRPWESATPRESFSVAVRSQGEFVPKSENSLLPPAAPRAGDSVGMRTSNAQAASSLPSAFNWCDQGGCTPVRNQGQCGSCWAFATAGAFESAIKIQDGAGQDLAEQYLVSCNEAALNPDGVKWGCGGGWWAFHYYQDAVPSGQPDAGAVYEADFPYQAADVSCGGAYTHHEKVVSWGYVDNWYSIPPVADLKQAIYDHGPVAVAICANSAMHSYSGGVFENSSGCGDSINHGVVLVGWDDSQGTNGIWYMKNSWGSGWGEDGYMRIGYGVANVGYGAVYAEYEGSGAGVNPPTGVTITGPVTGAMDVSHTFTATVSPSTATQPIDYTWDASGKSPVTHSDDLVDTVTFSWDTPGNKTVSVAAANDAGSVNDAHSITVCYPADLDCDCDVDVVDVDAVASRWRCEPGDPDWDPRYDLDGDGVLTSVDVTKVVADWGWTCP